MWDLDLYLTELEAAGRAAGTVRLRRWQLSRFAAAHPDPAAVGGGDVARWLAAARASETRKSWRAALRGYYLWAIRSGRADRDPTAALLPIRVPRPLPRPCPSGTAAAAIAAARPDVRLMLELAASAGLRRAEIAGLHRSDLQGDALRVTGKGGNVRLVTIPPGLARRIADRGPGWVFPGRRGGPITPDAAGRLMSAALGPGWSAHTLRHGCATSAYARSQDIRAVQELLGHTSPATTARYVAVAGEAVRRAAAAAAEFYGVA